MGSVLREPEVGEGIEREVGEGIWADILKSQWPSKFTV
jgi:hypothetical protein